jgi:hypothetical protein
MRGKVNTFSKIIEKEIVVHPTTNAALDSAL